MDPASFLKLFRRYRWIHQRDGAKYSTTFSKMRSNIMELVCRYQQAPWWPHGMYTESILTTLIITRKFGWVYPIFDSSHQYGLTAWYKLLMYCINNDNHKSLVNIFMGRGSWIVQRVDKDTINILGHIR